MKNKKASNGIIIAIIVGAIIIAGGIMYALNSSSSDLNQGSSSSQDLLNQEVAYNTETEQENERPECEVKYQQSNYDGQEMVNCVENSDSSDNEYYPIMFCKNSEGNIHIFKRIVYCDANNLCQERDEIVQDCQNLGENYYCNNGSCIEFSF